MIIPLLNLIGTNLSKSLLITSFQQHSVNLLKSDESNLLVDRTYSIVAFKKDLEDCYQYFSGCSRGYIHGAVE